MYIMYVDESGDPGNVAGSSPYYILSAVIFTYKDWYKILDLLKRMRRHFHKQYGLSPFIEIHASELLRVNKIKAYTKIKRTDRMNILADYAKYIPIIFKGGKIINVCFDKSKHAGVTDFNKLAYSRLISRYDSFLKRSVKEEGIIISDESYEKPLRNQLRKMRVYNPIQSHFTNSTYNAKITKIIEDIVHRNSSVSYFIQTVDVIAFLLKHKEYPKGSGKKHNLDKHFKHFTPLLHRPASPSDPEGIVRK